MKRFFLLLVLVALGWYGYTKYPNYFKTQRTLEAEIQSSEPGTVPLPRFEGPSGAAFKCDGRTYCSQMTSCAEATFFLKNCPGTKMDGDNNGIPCEKQWCN